MAQPDKRLLAKAMQEESTWIQKALFALGKVETARANLAEISEKDVGDLRAPTKNKTVGIGDVRTALEDRVATLMEKLEETRRIAR